MRNHQKFQIKFQPVGIDLVNPIAEIPENKVAYMQNMRLDYGVPETRKKLVNLLAITGAGALSKVKNIFRLNYPLLSKRFIVVGEHVYYHDITSGTLTYIEAGWEAISSEKSKWPSAVYIRPEESIHPWLYISCAGGNKFKKFSVNADYEDVGITTPSSALVVEEDKPIWKSIDELGSTVASWTASAGAVISSVVRINQTISTIIYDAGTSGFCSIIPDAIPNSLQTGTQLSLGGTEDVLIGEVLSSVLALGTATVKSVKYDSGSTGRCTIHLTVVPEKLIKNCILRFNATIICRVLDIIKGANNETAIVVNSGASTISAGHSVEGLASFRTYTNLTHAAAETITTNSMKTVIAAAGEETITRIANNDFTVAGTGADARAITDSDYILVGILASNQNNIDGIQVKLNVTDPAGSTRFTSDYYYYAINPNVLTPVATFNLSTAEAIQRQIQRNQIYRSGLNFRNLEGRENFLLQDGIDSVEFFEFGPNFNPNNIPNELNLGSFVWSVFRIKRSDFQRVGNDLSRGWKDIDAIQFSIKANDAVDVYFDSLLLEGSYDLDSDIANNTTLNPLYYIYRYRSTKTRAISNWSPPQRDGLLTSRRRIKLTIPQSSDAQVDKIDIARIGARLGNMHYVGTKDNDANPYFDSTPDSIVIQNPIAIFDNYKPFAVLDKSKKGTCNVIGNKIVRTAGDIFDIRWARGSQIIIDGKVNRLYTNPASTTELELENSLGTLAAVSFYLPAPLLTGVVLPKIFGPFGEGNLGLFIFGLGYENSRGTLYWLNGNAPDVMSDLNYLEITSPSEPLIDGCILKGVPYVFSSERIFQILATFVNNRIEFVARQMGGIKGVIGDLVVGRDEIYFASKDGIYSFDGNNITRISDDIQTVLPRFGATPKDFTVLDFVCPAIDPVSSEFQMEFFEDKLYVRTLRVSPVTMMYLYIYDINKKGWIIDTYHAVNVIETVITEYGDTRNQLLFGSIGAIYTYGDGATIEVGNSSVFLTRSYDFGDSRALKDIAELYTEIEGNDAQIATQLIYINELFHSSQVFTFTTIAPAIVKEEFTKDVIADGTPISGRRIGLGYSINTGGFGNGVGFRINECQISFLARPESIIKRFTDWEGLDRKGSKYVKTLVIDAITNGAQSLILEGDNGLALGTIIINHPTRLRMSYSVPNPNYTHLVRLKPTNAINWQLFDFDFVFDEAPEEDESPTDWTNGEFIGEKLVKYLILDADTENNIVNLNVEKDGEIVAATLPIQHDKRHERAYEFIPPFLAHNLRLRPSDPMRIFEFKFVFEKWAENVNAPTDFDNGGYEGFKYLQRIELDADTNNAIINIDIEDGMGNVLVNNLPIQHNGRRTISYDFNPVPGYNFRVVPTADVRIFGVKYRFDLQPEGQRIWKAQPTTFDISGYKTVRKVFISMKSSVSSTFTLTIDGVDYEYEVPSTANLVRKVEISTKAVKGLLFEPQLFADEKVTLYKKDCEFHVYPINGGDAVIANPFGHIHRELGTA